MRNKSYYLGALAVAALGISSLVTQNTSLVVASEDGAEVNPLKEIISGYEFRSDATKAMQDDDFENPAFVWVEQGEALWNTAEGTDNKSCADCHGDASESMKGMSNKYPMYVDALGKLQNLEQKVMEHRAAMGGAAWKWESPDMLSMMSYIKVQSRGMPVNVTIDGPAAPFFQKGKAEYYQKRGQLDMSCADCHEKYFGIHIRSDLLSQGHSNGFPTYRLKWQGVGSLHRRFRGCNKNIRAQNYPYGSDEYVNMELYLAWRGTGMAIESPALRN